MKIVCDYCKCSFDDSADRCPFCGLPVPFKDGRTPAPKQGGDAAQDMDTPDTGKDTERISPLTGLTHPVSVTQLSPMRIPT